MNTPSSSAHIADDDLERLLRRTLPAAAVVPLTDHLADCPDCQRRLSRSVNIEAALASFGDVWDHSSTHVTESDVHAFVDGRLDDRRRDQIARHLDLCASCRDEIRDLQDSAEIPAPSRPPWTWQYGGLAAAAILLLALTIPTLLRTDRSPTVTLLNDAGGPVRIDAQGNPQVTGLVPGEAERLRRTLSSGRLSFPSHVQDLAAARGVLRSETRSAGFELIAPVATAVLDDRPMLRWTSASPSATYVATLQDAVTGATSSSPVLRTLEWTPREPLTRGGTYLWQVAASSDGRETVTPAPPEPPAKLFVLSAADALRVAQVPPSHLVRGIVYAEVGLVEEAERELSVLSAENPGSNLAEGLLRQIKELRGRTTPSGSR